uniref:Tubulin-specific chaperone D n=1 Tax=Ascaris lumbricoides TaxID=6252 RepID=A0A9J2PD52_ASCLU
MQEKVLLEVAPALVGDDSPDDATISAPSPLHVLASAHQEEIFSLIRSIPSFGSSPREEEYKFERFRYLLDLYQEQPVLLDPCINDMITTLLSFVKLLGDGQTRFNNASTVAMKFLSHIAKVRGYKHFLSLLPHEVCYMEKVLVCMEKYSDSNYSEKDHEVHYVLLLWMTILCKNPFDFNRFDSSSERPSTVQRIIRAVMPYLYTPISKFHPVAALLLATVVTREDARAKLLPSTVESCVGALGTCSAKSSNDVVLVANLFLLTAIFKHGRREDLFASAGAVLRAVSRLIDFEKADFVVKKLLVKLVQRLGMVFLKPRVCKWRYERGNRVLALDSESVKKVKESATRMEVNRLEDDDDYDIPCEELEVVLDTVLCALRDQDTDIRWSAAKGVGRVASRLPMQLANDVLSSILAHNFDELAGHAAWHGGCLAIAELSRRGYLLPERLPDVVPVLLKALVFEERQGRHALGANVRDAACYISWALARAFRPSDLAPYVSRIATSLVCVALFDREINVRRAASAAFQENVGRQCSFPNGIEILTLIDYFAVGMRRHAYLEVSVEVAKYSLYSRPLIEHLADYKVTHWSEDIRVLAAEALRRLSALDASAVLEQVLIKIVPLVGSQQPISRQGGILALAGSLSGLSGSGVVMQDSFYQSVARIPSDTFAMCEKKTQSIVGLLMRRAMNSFIHLLSTVIPPQFIPLEDWLKTLDLIVCDENERLRTDAVAAASQFFTIFTCAERVDLLVDRVNQRYIHRVLRAEKECAREGIASLLGVLPPSVYAIQDQDHIPLYAKIVNALIAVVDGRSGIDASWAYGRRASIDALAKIVSVVGLDSLSLSDSSRLIDCVINALNDYTTDSRGDVGRVLRASAMRALGMLLPIAERYNRHTERVDEAICKIVQQSCEKIDATRICAAEVLCDLIHSGLDIVEKETLRMTYLPECIPSGWQPHDWGNSACFTRLAALLSSQHYRYHALSGFVISAGGLGESTMRGASDALLEVLNAHRDSSPDMEVFLHDLAAIFSNNVGIARVTLPLLRTLEQIFSAEVLNCFGALPDSSPSLAKIIDLVAAEAAAKGNPQKVRIAVTILCHALHFNCDSRIWHKAASVIVRTLRSPYPTLRRSAAEQLYECIASEVVNPHGKENGNRSELLNILTKTEWQVDGEQDRFSELSSSIARMLNVGCCCLRLVLVVLLCSHWPEVYTNGKQFHGKIISIKQISRLIIL